MIMKDQKVKFNSGWCFAIVNGCLAEIYFKEKYGIYAHGYIERKEFDKREQKMIDADIKKFQFSYRKGCYFDKILKIRHRAVDFREVFPASKKLKRLS